jgi:diacylglycerol kinase family enzyme
MPTPRFDSCIVIKNPISTDIHKVEGRIEELRRLFPSENVTVVETLPGGSDANASLLRSYMPQLGPRTLLCIAAGDGTISLVINFLLRHPSLSAEARRTPILPLWCGNANDLAHMLNGRSSRMALERLLRDGKVVAIKPLQCKLRYDGRGTETYLAACYASFGASAFAAYELERTMRKQRRARQAAMARFGRELAAVVLVLFRARSFTIRDAGGMKTIFERVFVNGSRFAKVDTVPLQLTDDRFYRTTIERKHLSAIVARLAEIVRPGAKVALTNATDEFTLQDDVWAQFDGEPVRVPADTTVAVALAVRPFYALSVRLASK